MPLAEFERGIHRIEIVFELHEHGFRASKQIVLLAHEIDIEMFVRAENQRDLVFAFRIDGDARCGGRPIVVHLPATRHMFFGDEFLRVLGECIVAERADERRRRALA